MSSLSTPSTPFVSLVCVLDSDLDTTLLPFAQQLAEHFPLHEIIAVSRTDQGRLPAPVLANTHLLQLTPPLHERTLWAAGLDHCLGDIIVMIDPQHDEPSTMLAAIRAVHTNNNAVYVSGGNRRWPGAKWLEKRLLGMQAPRVDGPRAFTREILNTWLSHSDRDRLLEVFPAISGYSWTTLPAPQGVQRRPWRWRLAGIASASPAPLRFAYALAVLGAGLNLLYSVYVVLLNLLRGNTVEGWTSLSLQIAGMFFLVSLILAALAEYVYQVVKRNNDTPLYQVQQELSASSLPAHEQLNIESDR